MEEADSQNRDLVAIAGKKEESMQKLQVQYDQQLSLVDTYVYMYVSVTWCHNWPPAGASTISLLHHIYVEPDAQSSCDVCFLLILISSTGISLPLIHYTCTYMKTHYSILHSHVLTNLIMDSLN